MARSYAPRTYNPNRYHQRSRELENLDTTASHVELLTLIGAITTVFEQCESELFTLLRKVTTDPDLLGTIFNIVNARATRNQIIAELLDTHTPKRPTKRHKRIVALFERYAELGPFRDEVAHSVRVDWKRDGEVARILQPAHHRERKYVTGLPTYHYDKPALEALAAKIVVLANDLREMVYEVYAENTERLKAGKPIGAVRTYVPAPELAQRKAKSPRPPRSSQRSPQPRK
jgi:hypothetical protein